MSGRPQHWSVADEDLRQWVEAIVGRLGQIEGVVAVYLHGSLAMGSYFRPKSDVDLLVVVEDPLVEPKSRALAADFLESFDHRPIIGGVELSVVRWRSLESHCTMTRLLGLAVLGPAPASVIGEVPHDAYLDAVMDDARWIVEGGIVESPFYGVLNLCRSLQLVLEDPELRPSKDEGARWALDNLPVEHRPIVAAALECYRSHAQVPPDLRRFHGHRWDEEPLLDIAAYAQDLLHSHL